MQICSLANSGGVLLALVNFVEAFASLGSPNTFGLRPVDPVPGRRQRAQPAACTLGHRAGHWGGRRVPVLPAGRIYHGRRAACRRRTPPGGHHEGRQQARHIGRCPGRCPGHIALILPIRHVCGHSVHSSESPSAGCPGVGRLTVCAFSAGIRPVYLLA